MTCCATSDLTIDLRETFIRTLRWGSLPFVYAPITAITAAAPPVITAAAHGVPDGWRVAVVSAGGMRQINAKYNPPRSGEFSKAAVLTANSLSINAVNAADYDAYTSGGYVQYYTPNSLAGYTARFRVWATEADAAAGTTPLLSLVSGVAAPLSGITLDDTAKTITLLISETDIDAFTWTVGFYELDLIASDSTVTELLTGNVTVAA